MRKLTFNSRIGCRWKRMLPSNRDLLEQTRQTTWQSIFSFSHLVPRPVGDLCQQDCLGASRLWGAIQPAGHTGTRMTIASIIQFISRSSGLARHHPPLPGLIWIADRARAGSVFQRILKLWTLSNSQTWWHLFAPIYICTTPTAIEMGTHLTLLKSFPPIPNSQSTHPRTHSAKQRRH